MKFQNLIQEFKAVVSDEDDLELRGMSELKELLFVAYQNSNSDVEIIFLETNSPLQI